MFLLGTINLQFYDGLILTLSHKQSWASLIRKVATLCQTGSIFFFYLFFFPTMLESNAWGKGVGSALDNGSFQKSFGACV